MSIVYTIGYEGTDIERFLETLKLMGITQVADVRAVALSRKRGFSKKALSARLESEGIEYLHFAELGDPKEGREAARAGLYTKFRAIYTSHIDTKGAQVSFQKLVGVAAKRPTCLLCFERDPATCHRSIVAERMSKSGFQAFDLYGDDPERYVRNAPRMPSHHPCEGITTAQ